MVAGGIGGKLSVDTILILGFSSVVADAISMGVGDAPLEFTNATVFVDFNATIGQYENCFEIRLAPGVYYLDETIT